MFLGMLLIALVPVYLIQLIIQKKQEAAYREPDLSGQQGIKA